MSIVTKSARKIKPAVSAPAAPPIADIRVSNHGSVFLFEPTSFDAAEMLLDLVPPGTDHHYFAHSLVVEWRYAEAVAEQLREDGMTVA